MWIDKPSLRLCMLSRGCCLLVIFYCSAATAQESDDYPRPAGGWNVVYDRLIYPERARFAGIAGKVIVQVHVDTSGQTTETKAFESPDSLLTSAAVILLKSLEWNPAKKDGKPINAWATVPILFVAETDPPVATVEDRTFVKRNGYWVQKSYTGQELINLTFNSEALKSLQKENKFINRVLDKLGKQVIFSLNTKWLKVIDVKAR